MSEAATSIESANRPGREEIRGNRAQPGKARHDADWLNLKSIALACIGQLLFQDRDAVSTGFEQDYLLQVYRSFAGEDDLAGLLDQYLGQPQGNDRDLAKLADHLDLDRIELLTIALAIAVEEDPMVGRVIAFIQAPVGGSRPTLGLLQSAFAAVAEPDQGGWIAGSLVAGKAVSSGILTILNREAPLPEQNVKIPGHLALALGHKNAAWPGTASFPESARVQLPPSILADAGKHAESLQNQPDNVLVIRSASLREARSVADEIARRMHFEPIFTRPEPANLHGLGVLCLMQKRLPVFEYDLGPSDIETLPELPGYRGARIAIVGPDGNIESQSGSILQWTIPVPGRDERRALWQNYLGDAELAERLAQAHLHGSGRIMQLAGLSLREARLHRREQPNDEDIRQAAWTAEEGNLGSLVQPITARVPDAALVLPTTTEQELDYLLERCKNRENLDDELGVTLRARYQIGVRALLVGPSGTGKTLAASWIATRLGLPLYRVDIASVVSKYIGETEKNLATLLARAEQTEIVLLFDEADSLFGKRTEIKDANDRHANSQTNYLLQRIELYRGIVLLTSNSRGRFDSAFTRRLDKVVEFSLPAPEERRALWQSHLGDGHRLSPRQLNQLALSSELAGGHIRNAVLAAAVQAKSRGRRIDFDDIVIGLEGEYRKLGRQLPAEIRHYQQRSNRT